jgi:hypothetical protein
MMKLLVMIILNILLWLSLRDEIDMVDPSGGPYLSSRYVYG